MGKRTPTDTNIAEKAIKEFVAAVLPSKSKVFMGIDCGGTGGIALVCDEHYVVVDYPMKLEPRKGLTKKGEQKTRGVPDLWGILFLFTHLRPIKERIRAVIEQALIQVGGGGESAYIAFRVAEFYFVWPLFLLGREYKYIPVRPIEWKKAMGVTVERAPKGHKLTKAGKKGPSVALAKKLFPKADVSLDKDGRADALLLAEFARRTKIDWENITYGEV